jgi:tetratricopeptide (TPR) repeat protein
MDPEQRRDLHAKVGEALEVMFTNRLEEQASILAHHYTLAENPVKALAYHRMAGDEAFRVNANYEAADHYESAMEFMKDDAQVSLDEISHLHLNLGRAFELTTQYDRALTVYDELRELGERRGAPGIALRALLAKTTLQVTPTPLFDSVVGRQTAEEALQLARELNDPQAEAKTLWVIGMLGRLTGRDAEVIGAFEQSLAIAEKHDLEEQVGSTLTDLYWSYLVKEHMETARRTVDRAHQIWVKRSNFPMMVDTLAGKVFMLYLTGEYRQAIETASEAWELSERIDNVWGMSYSLLYSGMVQIEMGEIGTAFETMQRSIELGIRAGFFVPEAILPGLKALAKARVGTSGSTDPLRSDPIPGSFEHIVSPFLRLIDAQVHIHRGDLDQARIILADTTEESALMSTVYLVNPLALTLASFADAVGDHEQVLGITSDAIQSLSARGIVTHLPILIYLQAKALEQSGRRPEALDQLDRGLQMTSFSGARWPTWQLLALRARLKGEMGENVEAEKDLRSAAELVRYIADHIGDEQLQESFLKRADVVAIIAQVR